MRKLLFVFCAGLFILSCKNKKNLQEQLNENFVNHLIKIDSSASLDSVHILWKISLTERMGRVIDDSIYRREFMRVQEQLNQAQQKNKKDSIDFYQYETDFMEKEIDSVTKSIAKGDTSRKYGFMIALAYQIRKNEKSTLDSTFIIMDSTATLRYTEIMDSSIRRSLKNLN